jgi:transposase-like protein
MAPEAPRDRPASLEKADDKLFTFTQFPKRQWKSIGTSNAIGRPLHEEFSAETAAMRKVDDSPSPNDKASDEAIDLAT